MDYLITNEHKNDRTFSFHLALQRACVHFHHPRLTTCTFWTGDKAKLIHHILKLVPTDSETPEMSLHIIIDGVRLSLAALMISISPGHIPSLDVWY